MQWIAPDARPTDRDRVAAAEIYRNTVAKTERVLHRVDQQTGPASSLYLSVKSRGEGLHVFAMATSGGCAVRISHSVGVCRRLRPSPCLAADLSAPGPHGLAHPSRLRR